MINKEIDFEKSEINPRGEKGYIKVVYKDKSELHEPIDEDALKVIEEKTKRTIK